jgi:hypothetical protein
MKVFFLVALAAFMAGMVGCKSNDAVEGLNEKRVNATRSAIQSTIPDAALRGKMMAVLDQYELELKQIEDSIKKTRTAIVTANADYATDRATLEGLYAQLAENVRQMGHVFRDRNFQLRKLCTPEQWDDLADDNDTLVEFVFGEKKA